MKFDRNSLLLYAVTDRKWTSPQVSLYDQVCAAIDGGVSCVQLREKQLDESDFLAQARLIGKLCRARRVPFIINDNGELALRCQADGVHIGQDDMDAQQVRKRIGEQMILGVSAHNVEEARTAFQNGADYLGAGAVFSTSTKNNVTTLPLDILREICSSVELPVVAIGVATSSSSKAPVLPELQWYPPSSHSPTPARLPESLPRFPDRSSNSQTSDRLGAPPSAAL